LDFGLASDKELLESHVAQLLSGALQAFLQGDMGEAERLLGQQPEQEIFHVTPRESMGARWRQHWMVGIGVLLLMVLLAFSWWSGHYNYPTQGRRLKAVQVHEDDVRLALDRLSSSPSQDRETWRAFDHALYFGCLVFPPQDSFAPKAWANLQDYLFSKHHVQKAEILNDPNEVLRAFFENHNQHYLNPVKKGLWTSTELTQMRVTPSMARRYLAELSPWVRGHLGQVQEIGVSGEEYTALYVEECAVQIRLLQYLDCLDLVAGETLINQLCEHQVLPGHSLEGRKPISDRKLLHGLFHCMPSSPIRDTYYALVVLSALDGLDRIDREACIQGILRFHHGKGLFGSFKKDDGLHFTGGTHYTLLAYESLRMLNALGRVKDLHKWVFRPMGALTMAPQKVTWPEIEAWVLTQRLQEFIKEQRQNPNLKPPSLLFSTEI
jgi:hypothetical protein